MTPIKQLIGAFYMIPQNNICPFTLEYLHDKDILLIDKILEVATDLDYYQNQYTGFTKDRCLKISLKDFWNWVIKDYLPHVED